MTVIIADTSPLHYLALIGESHILPALFGAVIIPQKVLSELNQLTTPAAVKSFATSLPPWLEVRTVTLAIDSSLDDLDPGEREAITLALELNADTLLIDDNAGRNAAQIRGLAIMGTLRVLYDAAVFGLCDLEQAYDKMRQTNFHASEALYHHFLDLHKAHLAPPAG